ncbi:MAG: P-loop NTPase fold protein [Cyanobacteria bacterium P01_A01_bin.116]
MQSNGLDRQNSERALEEFLKTDNQEKVFAIKGGWGVGKTHLVRTLMSSMKQGYHYASIFGVSTVNELKMQLWSNFVSVNEGGEKSRMQRIKSFLNVANKNSKDFGNIVEAIPKMEDYGVGFTPALLTLTSNVLINKSLQNKLICIDDLERRTESLSLNEILGFIESLAEERNCKVIIIFNEEKIKEDSISSETLKEYREKVIDFEIELAPSVEDNFLIGFGEVEPDKATIFDYFEKANTKTNNIRVLKKIKLYLAKVRPYIKTFLPEVRRKIIEEVIFISLSRFDSTFFVDLKELLSLGAFDEILRNGNDKEKDIYLLANQLGYTGSIISTEIIRLVETSVFNSEIIYEEGRKLNDIENKHSIEKKLREAYRPYSESFGASEAELRENLTNFLENYCTFLSFQDLQGLIDITAAINLDIDCYWRKWFEHAINQAETLEMLYSLKSYIHNNDVFSDSELEDILDRKILTFEKNVSVDSILIEALNTKGWAKQDTDYLNSRTLDEWKKWLLKQHNDKYFMIMQGLKMGGKASITLSRAITDLAHDNDLNKMRAEKLYNFSLEDQSEIGNQVP